MKWLILLSSFAIPIVMVIMQSIWGVFHHVFNLLALVAVLVFGNIAAFKVYEIIRDDAVFMTTIHGLFLHPMFLIATSYLGIYLLYKLLVGSFAELINDVFHL